MDLDNGAAIRVQGTYVMDLDSGAARRVQRSLPDESLKIKYIQVTGDEFPSLCLNLL